MNSLTRSAIRLPLHASDSQEGCAPLDSSACETRETERHATDVLLPSAGWQAPLSNARIETVRLPKAESKGELRSSRAAWRACALLAAAGNLACLAAALWSVL